ncbi:hypothetical protein ACFFX0_33075 [Citricoccus parietis]|uniref:Uncharacterized protein n=1 Tax=Citricoccus parietis TaxID=592307 RepID=A0ABV5G9Z8_9MICC
MRRVAGRFRPADSGEDDAGRRRPLEAGRPASGPWCSAVGP